MSNNVTVKITLQHVTGALSSYKSSGIDPELGGIKEAIVSCFSNYGGMGRCDLLRADIAGADWTRLDRAKAVLDLQQRLIKAADDLSDGHLPKVIFQLNEAKQVASARLETDESKVPSAETNPDVRILEVPRILPFQMGGDANGAHAVVYVPKAGGGMQLHSMHPTNAEAMLAESYLKTAGELKTGILLVATPVTQLLAEIASPQYKAPGIMDDAEPTPHPAATARPHPGLMPSPLSAPRPAN